ncbi:MAG: 3'-5' exoribonuclease YhaM family protein [Thermovirgaceae bacterium]
MSEDKAMTTLDIRALPPGKNFKVTAAIASVKARFDKNRRLFWEMAIMDTEGSLEAKVWSDAKWWDARSGQKTPLAPDKLDIQTDLLNSPVGVFGTVTEFKGRPQYQFNEIYLLDEGKYPLSMFLERSPVPLEDMERELWEMIGGCGDPVKSFLAKVFDGPFWEIFRNAPAAVSHHHAYVHGLLEHTLAVTRGARALAAAYSTSGFGVDMGIVTAGGLLHDIGKLDAYSLDPFPSVTVPGTVIDHIPLGYARFVKLAEEHELDDATSLAIGHILVSHHGRREYGSPVLPATPEALIVSSADELDFVMYCWQTARESPGGEPEVSDYHPSAQRRFWKRPNHQDENERGQ